MPESSRRKKKAAAYTPPPTKQAKNRPPSPPWYGALILVCFAIGVAWLVTYYVSNGVLPVRSLGGANIIVGFGFIVVGFGLSTRWR